MQTLHDRTCSWERSRRPHVRKLPYSWIAVSQREHSLNTEDKPSPAGNDNSEAEAVQPDDLAPFERWLDRKLKSVYGSVLEEPIPQDILDLLRQRLDGN